MLDFASLLIIIFSREQEVSMSCCSCHINRREFLELTAASKADVSLAGVSSLYENKKIEDWDPNK